MRRKWINKWQRKEWKKKEGMKTVNAWLIKGRMNLWVKSE